MRSVCVRRLNGWPATARVLLLPLNDAVVVGSAREAIDAALSLAVVPDGYRADLLACLGFSGVTADELFAAAHRLVAGTVDLVSAGS